MIENISARMDLEQILEFMLHGVEAIDLESESSCTRLKQRTNAIYKRLEELCPDEKSLDEAAAELSKALTAHERVYTEIGMKAGARLVYQLLLAGK